MTRTTRTAPMPATLSRRALMGAAAALVPGTAMAGRKAGSDGFDYEVTRSEAEWRAMLSDEEYVVLRNGATEWPRSSDLWQETRDGTYHCRGCELEVFGANHQVPLDKGWVFFRHSEPNAVLTGIEGPVPQYGQAGMVDPGSIAAFLEIHCRRCGSHLGHYLPVDGQNLHCINGAALAFRPA